MNRNSASLAAAVGLIAAGTLGFALSREYRRRLPISDEVIARNINEVFRKVLHDQGIVEAVVSNGAVSLSGSIQHDELPSLLSAVKNLPGVRCINNQLRLRADAAGVGEPVVEKAEPRRRSKHRHTAPSTGITGVVLMAAALLVASRVVEQGFNKIEALNAEDLHFAY